MYAHSQITHRFPSDHPIQQLEPRTSALSIKPPHNSVTARSMDILLCVSMEEIYTSPTFEFSPCQNVRGPHRYLFVFGGGARSKRFTIVTAFGARACATLLSIIHNVALTSTYSSDSSSSDSEKEDPSPSDPEFKNGKTHLHRIHGKYLHPNPLRQTAAAMRRRLCPHQYSASARPPQLCIQPPLEI